MNIFVTSPDPIKCAEYLDDKRVNKMILESAQMLSTVSGKGYKPTHKTHPCTLWVSECLSNYNWLYRHFKALLSEYTKRRGRIHKCSELLELLKPPQIQYTQPSYFVNCSGHKEEKNVYRAYRRTLDEKWAKDKREPVWYGVKRENVKENIKLNN